MTEPKPEPVILTQKPPQSFTVRRRDPRLKWIIIFTVILTVGSGWYIYSYGLDAYINLLIRIFQWIYGVLSTYIPKIFSWLKIAWEFMEEFFRTLRNN